MCTYTHNIYKYLSIDKKGLTVIVLYFVIDNRNGIHIFIYFIDIYFIDVYSLFIYGYIEIHR